MRNLIYYKNLKKDHVIKNIQVSGNFSFEESAHSPEKRFFIDNTFEPSKYPLQHSLPEYIDLHVFEAQNTIYNLEDILNDYFRAGFFLTGKEGLALYANHPEAKFFQTRLYSPHLFSAKEKCPCLLAKMIEDCFLELSRGRRILLGIQSK